LPVARLVQLQAERPVGVWRSCSARKQSHILRALSPT
jgi:hypothetical protein